MIAQNGSTVTISGGVFTAGNGGNGGNGGSIDVTGSYGAGGDGGRGGSAIDAHRLRHQHQRRHLRPGQRRHEIQYWA